MEKIEITLSQMSHFLQKGLEKRKKNAASMVYEAQFSIGVCNEKQILYVTRFITQEMLEFIIEACNMYGFKMCIEHWDRDRNFRIWINKEYYD